MKRFIFSAIALLVVATACTESGIIDTPAFYDNAIVFDTYIGKTPVTKALSFSEEELKESGVQIYAFRKDATSGIDYSAPYLNGQLQYSSGWAYYEEDSEVDAYWPEGYDLAFAAYSLNAGNIEVSDEFDFDFTVADVVSEQVDLLAIPLLEMAAATNGDTQVTLDFKHLLSRVGYSVYATNGGIEIEIQNIVLKGNFPKNGNVDLKSNPAKITPYTTGDKAQYVQQYAYFEEGQSFSIDADDCLLSGDGPQPIFVDDEDERFMMIMPYQVNDASIEVTYELTGSSPHTATVELGDWEFKAGYAYEFVFKISSAAIEFNAVIAPDGWGTEETHPNN